MRSWAEGLEILNLESSLHKYLRNPTQVLFSNLSDWHSLLRCSTVPIRFVTASAVLQIGYYDLANICGERGIRTPGTLRYTTFPMLHNRPLCHLSESGKIQPFSVFVNQRIFIPCIESQFGHRKLFNWLKFFHDC